MCEKTTCDLAHLAMLNYQSVEPIFPIPLFSCTICFLFFVFSHRFFFLTPSSSQQAGKQTIPGRPASRANLANPSLARTTTKQTNNK
jgi:hypothetical protein